MVQGTVSSIYDNQQEGRVDTYLADSWFALVDYAVEFKKRFNTNFIGIIKTNPSRFPKKFLEETMKEWSPGSHLVLQMMHNDFTLFACRYKCNKH